MSKLKMFLARTKSQFNQNGKQPVRPGNKSDAFGSALNILFVTYRQMTLSVLRIAMAVISLAFFGLSIIRLVGDPYASVEWIAGKLVSSGLPFGQAYGIFGFSLLTMIIMLFVTLIEVMNFHDAHSVDDLYESIADLEQHTQDRLAEIYNLIDTEVLPRKDTLINDVSADDPLPVKLVEHESIH